MNFFRRVLHPLLLFIGLGGVGEGAEQAALKNLVLTNEVYSAQRFTNRLIHADLVSEQYRSYVVEFSSNLVFWQALNRGFDYTGGPMKLGFQIRADSPAGFYRLRQTNVVVFYRPAFVREPVDTEVRLGQRVSLSAEVIGIEPIVFQWYKDQKPIPGATNSHYAILRARLEDAGQYWLSARTIAAGHRDTDSGSALAVLRVIHPRWSPAEVSGKGFRLDVDASASQDLPFLSSVLETSYEEKSLRVGFERGLAAPLLGAFEYRVLGDTNAVIEVASSRVGRFVVDLDFYTPESGWYYIYLGQAWESRMPDRRRGWDQRGRFALVEARRIEDYPAFVHPQKTITGLTVRINSGRLGGITFVTSPAGSEFIFVPDNWVGNTRGTYVYLPGSGSAAGLVLQDYWFGRVNGTVNWAGESKGSISWSSAAGAFDGAFEVVGKASHGEDLAPASISGLTVKMAVIDGAGVFAGDGAYVFQPAPSGGRYVVRPLTFVGTSDGTYSYRKTGPDTAVITTQDSLTGSASGTVRFFSQRAGRLDLAGASSANWQRAAFLIDRGH